LRRFRGSAGNKITPSLLDPTGGMFVKFSKEKANVYDD
jgi:hypothetical protein